MSAGIITTFVLIYGFAFWLGLYLIRRDPRSPRLVWTGLGLVAYALALVCDLLANATTNQLALMLARVRWPLLLLPALCWTGALAHLLPEEWPLQNQVSRLWRIALVPAVGLLALVSFGTDAVLLAAGDPRPNLAVQLAAGAVVLLPLLALAGLVWRSARQQRTRQAIGVLLVVTIFFALSTGLILFPLGWLPRFWSLVLLDADLVCLGLAIAYFDAFDQGEALLPDMLRSFTAALLAALLFGGQVALVIALATGPAPPLLALLLATVAAAIAVPTFADPLGTLLDRLTLGRLPRVQEARAELRAVASALPRANPAFDPATLDAAEFVRLTRRALSHFGDLSRLATNPLTQLPLVRRRLAARGARDDTLERAAELKALLVESIARLKPRTGDDFGVSDEWRYYNALYFPYVAGLKPYSQRAVSDQTDPAAREALAWFRASVPERTLYNWQTAAARLVAHDLRTRSESETMEAPVALAMRVKSRPGR